jgi:cytochrome c oxidase subunit IV
VRYEVIRKSAGLTVAEYMQLGGDRLALRYAIKQSHAKARRPLFF